METETAAAAAETAGEEAGRVAEAERDECARLCGHAAGAGPCVYQ